MTAKDDIHHAAKKVASEVKHAASEIDMPELKDIKKDVDSLKTNVVGLALHLKDIGAEKTQAAADYVRGQADGLKTSGLETLEKAEKRVKAQPAQSVAIAFAVGILASFLLGRRTEKRG